MSRSRARLLPMVKANGYGLGAVAVSRALESLDPWGFGVAATSEGAELRRRRHRAADRRVLAHSGPRTSPAVSSTTCGPRIGDLASLAAWLPDGAAISCGHRHRDVACRVSLERWQCARRAVAHAGECTRDGKGSSLTSTPPTLIPRRRPVQWERFEMVLGAMPSRPPLVHAANSAAALIGTRYAADLVRPGIFLYGGSAGGMAPAPVARLCAPVIDVRQLHGRRKRELRRHLDRSGPFHHCHAGHRLRRRHATVALRATARSSWRGTAQPDRRARHDGHDHGGGGCRGGRGGPRCSVGVITLDQQAAAAGTISYELLTRLGARLERRYSGPDS